jgi:hypothetical protein
MTRNHDTANPDLGFRVRQRKGGDLEILHRGRLAATLRGQDALDFLQDTPNPLAADAQQTMARLTGNYKRGNERTASNHRRNAK